MLPEQQIIDVVSPALGLVLVPCSVVVDEPWKEAGGVEGGVGPVDCLGNFASIKKEASCSRQRLALLPLGGCKTGAAQSVRLMLCTPAETQSVVVHFAEGQRPRFAIMAERQQATHDSFTATWAQYQSWCWQGKSILHRDCQILEHADHSCQVGNKVSSHSKLISALTPLMHVLQVLQDKATHHSRLSWINCACPGNKPDEVTYSKHCGTAY
jgi:hypothetical protein